MTQWFLWLAGQEAADSQHERSFEERSLPSLAGMASETTLPSVPNGLSLNRWLNLFLLLGDL